MNYSYCKDLKPECTIKNILNILKNFKINIKEEIIERKVNSEISITAVHLKLNNLPLTNGKGISIKNAKASAYGELMERTQNQITFKTLTNNLLYSPDTIIINNFNKMKSKKDYFNSKLYIEIENILKNKDLNKYELIPFYNIKDKKICNIPLRSLLHNQLSNGMCAGNTNEEAIIQGLSEICERFAIREIISKKIKIPLINESEYKNYKTISEIIKYYELNGYKVYIKDASLNKGMPVICAQIVDIENNILHLSFGAHPSFAIAIERCLTEFIQCRDFDISEKKHFFEDERFFSKEYINYLIENDIYALSNAISMRHIALEQNDYFKEIFFSDKKDYMFNKNVWLEPETKKTNKEILQNFICQIKQLTGNNIFIRNVSYLKFPAFYIYIPELSNLKIYNNDKIQKLKCIYAWLNENIDKKIEYNNPKDLLSAMEFRIQNRFGYDSINNLKNTEIYIAILCSMLLKNTKKLNSFINILLSHNFYKNIFKSRDITLFRLIKDYCSLSETYNEEELKQILCKLYSKTELNYFFKFKDNLDFEIVKQITLKNITHHTKIQLSLQNKKQLDKINNILEKEYKKNIPAQNIIEDLFNFI